jgi:hypothetical protein
MQLVANQQLVKNRVRLGLVFHFGAMAVLIGGAVLSTQLDPAREIAWQTWVAFVAGLGLYTLGQTQLRRWGPGKRQEEQLGQAIRGLDDRYKLYAFLSSSLPDYILVSPAGVQVLVTRTDGGQISCVRDKWKSSGTRLMSLFGPGLGNPSADAARQLQKLRALLVEWGLQDVPTSSVIVFTNARAQLRVEGASSTITRLKELKDVLRRMAGKGTNVALTTSRIREIQRLFDARMLAAHSWR